MFLHQLLHPGKYVLKAHHQLPGDGTNGAVHGKGRADAVDSRVGQGQGAEQTNGHQQPRKINGPAAQPSSQKTANGQHQQDRDGSHQICFQQKIVDNSGTHGECSFPRREPFGK